MHGPVDYDRIASSFDARYAQNRYEGVQEAVLGFVTATCGTELLDVGCGTGHWLEVVSSRAISVAGMDPSIEMLRVAQRKAIRTSLAQARAEAFPFAAGSFDGVLCVNALHHFTDRSAFLAEARRVLRFGGGIFVVGLDAHVEDQRWWIYDHFEEALDLDRERYPSTAEIREMMLSAGFSGCATRQVQRFPAEVPFRSALASGLIDRRSTSQLMVISDEGYQKGMRSLHAAQEALGEVDLMLKADLRLYGTIGWVA